MAQESPRPAEAPPMTATAPVPGEDGPRLGLVLGAVAAIVAAGGLAWWFAAPAPSSPHEVNARPNQAAPVAQRAVEPLRYAAADPDPTAVRRAYHDVRHAYVDGAGEALVRASETCARRAPSEPQLLDYCVAYDIYASEVLPPDGGPDATPAQLDWFRDSASRDLALARTVLPPEAVPENRMAQLAALTRAVLPRTPSLARTKAPTRAARPHVVRTSVHTAPARAKHAAKTVARAAASRRASRLDEWLAKPASGQATQASAAAPETLDPPH